MRKIKKTLLVVGLTLVLFPTSMNAQLFGNNELFPNATTVKTESFHGTGGDGWWTLYIVDSLGRVVKQENYQKSQLMSRLIKDYDDRNNKVSQIQTFGINMPDRADTTKYDYKYSGNRIVYQRTKFNKNDSRVIKLLDNEGDSIFIYQEKAYHYKPNSGKNDSNSETIYTLRYRGGLLISKEIFNKLDNSKEMITFEHYDNGRLKRRLIERVPTPENRVIYIGGPGSDDEHYDYEFDSDGRITKSYKSINGSRLLVAVYSYE